MPSTGSPSLVPVKMFGLAIAALVVLAIVEYIGLQLTIGIVQGSRGGWVDGALAVEKHFAMSFGYGTIRSVLLLAFGPAVIVYVQRRWRSDLGGRMVAILLAGAVLALVLANVGRNGAVLTFEGYYFMATILAALLTDFPVRWALPLCLPAGYLLFVGASTKLALDLSALSDNLNYAVTFLRVLFDYAPSLAALWLLVHFWPRIEAASSR